VERLITEAEATQLTEFSPSVRRQSRGEGAGRAHAQSEGLPPLLERLVLDGDGKGASLHIVEAGRPESFLEVALSRACKIRLVMHSRFEFPCCRPERPEWSLPTRVIPHARRDGASGADHARHFSESGDRVDHEVHDELGKGHIEGVVRERKVLRRRLLGPDPRQARANRCNEGRRRLDGRDGSGTESPNKFRRQGSWARTYVESSLPFGSM
jgi:hypothetical protein